MIGPHAHRFGKVISDILLEENVCDRSADLSLDADQISDTKGRVRDVLQNITQLATGTGLDGRLGPEIGRFETALNNEPLRAIASRCNHLREHILDALAGQTYFHLPHADSQHYGQIEPFGTDVATTFAGSSSEFQQAAKCLSLQQSTACVFHLMRGMEIAVQQLAGVLGMNITPQTTWRQLTGNMDGIIRTMPNRTDAEKKNKDGWEDARINLHHLGSVLRNNTMHPGASYTQDEARHIFMTSSVVMKALCKL